MEDANPVSDTQILLQSMLQKLKLQPRPESIGTRTQAEVQYSTTSSEQNGDGAERSPQTPPMYNFNISTDRSTTSTGPGSLNPGSPGVRASFFEDFAKGIDKSGMSSTPQQRTPNQVLMSNHTVAGGNGDVSTHPDDVLMPRQDRNQKSLELNVQGQEVGERKWTQKVKEKWKERHQNISIEEGDDKGTQEQSQVSIGSPIPVQRLMSHDNNTTTVYNGRLEDSLQQQPINNGLFEDIPSPLDHMSETLFSPGTFNLMDEIFTGQEWAKYLPSSTSNQSASSFITQDQELGLTSSINQSHPNEQTRLNQWNYRGPELGLTQSQMNSGGFHTTEYHFNETKSPGIGAASMSELHNGQYGLSDSGSNHLESMDLSVSALGNNYPIRDQVHIYPYNQLKQKLNVESNQQMMDQSQTPGINHSQSGNEHDVLRLVDLSYVQSREDNSSLKKKTLLNRKRSYSTERRGSNERCRTETEEMHEWRHNPPTSDPTPSLSPASSTSSLQHSLSEESDLSVSTEIVIKKRRVENARRVRFSEVVTYAPPLLLTDDDGDADDEDYSHHDNTANDVREEESPSRLLPVPRWIEALRSKTRSKTKFKLPRIRTKKYRFM
ncbi:uncharacterized protein Hap1MRO34_012433 [Clarias gariepinus]|uniref:uncharacterized protein zgc:113229 n=1 Tax=Clarias gariepinus TaxID=13013 RepID=UPI00234E207C|nr:uncharacterized protein zgc:113229 [Clarias gariepinus]